MTALLKDQVVVVTGGAGLLGRTFSAAIAAHGGVAVVADRDFDAAEATVATIEVAHPGRALAIRLDITDRDSIAAVIGETLQRQGRLDAVVNNAYPRNARYGRRMEEVTYADFCENVGLHLGGYFVVAQQFAMRLRELGGGQIVNIGSIYGVVAPRFDVYEGTAMTMPVEYAAIKAGVIHLTRYFAQYLKGSGVRINSLSPGGILDGQPEEFLARYRSFCASKGMLAPADVSGALVFLLSDLSTFVSGQNLVVDDGFSQ